MDLIYTDENLNDIGVIQGYSLDMAYGKDENNFVLEMPLHGTELKEGYYIYIENTEYGGIIDSIGADTSSEKLSVCGRTWTGILSSKIISPNNDEDYFTVFGDANEVISQLITRCNLEEIFEVPNELSDIAIDGYSFRYNNLYSGLFYMLQSVNAKLMMRCKSGKITIYAQELMNYAAAEDFDSSIIQFKIDRVYNHVNHLICLGSGELKNRHVIHLFTDENGGIQQYLVDPNKPPLKDSDYILNTQNQILFGKDEIVDVYDYPSAETAVNYELLTAKPSDWSKNYFSYFEKNNDDEFTQIEQKIEDLYELTTSKPSNWNSTYDNYYTRVWEDDGWEYYPVEGDEVTVYNVVPNKPRTWTEHYSDFFYKEGNEYVSITAVKTYSPVSSQPSNWKKKYSDYYISDGVQYSNVTGVTKYKYIKQTIKPSNWKTNWKTDYYAPLIVGNKVTYVLLQSHPYYTRLSKAPTWKKNTFYTRDSYSVAPKFSSLGTVYKLTLGVPKFSDRTVYEQVITRTKTWVANMYYYKKADQDVGLKFQNDAYYRQVEDHFAALLIGAIERLNELSNVDTLDITLDESENEYNIGDIIGATEEITKVTTAQTIKKKIINIERGVLTVRHEV